MKCLNDFLGIFPHTQVLIIFKPQAQPIHHSAYTVTHLHQQPFKKELDHMVEFGILELCGVHEKTDCIRLPCLS